MVHGCVSGLEMELYFESFSCCGCVPGSLEGSVCSLSNAQAVWELAAVLRRIRRLIRSSCGIYACGNLFTEP